MDSGSKRKRNLATNHSVDVRNLAGRVYSKLRDEGFTVQEATQLLRECELTIGNSTYRGYQKRIKEGHDPVPGVVPPGRPRSLSKSQEEILVGWVVHKYVSHEQVDRDLAVDFLRDEFNIVLTPQSIGNYMNDNHLAEKK